MNVRLDIKQKSDIVAVQAEIDRLEGELVQTRAEMKRYLEELGYGQ